MSSATPLLAKPRQAEVVRPNILLIVADELAAWMCGCYGNKEIRTPNIDLLGRLGARLLNAFVVTPADAPSLATLFTGRTPGQHGIKDILTGSSVKDSPRGQAAPPASFAREIMISDILSKAGYQCGYVGKWGLGHDASPGHGYSYTCTMAAADSGYRNPVMYRNGKPVTEQGYLAELITRAACGFLDEQSKKERFFLTVSYPNPHAPYGGHPQRYYDMYANTSFNTIGWQPVAPNAGEGKSYLKNTVASIRKVAAATTALDDQVRVLFNKLRAKKLWQDTLLIFTSDNGFLLGRHGLWGSGRGSDPVNMYDEVMRVPFLISWPGQIPVESTPPEMFSFYDVLPTLCQFTRVAVPVRRNLCGHSLYYPLLAEPLPKKDEPARPKIVFGSYRTTRMARDTRFKLVIRNNGGGPNELYSLRRDPGETQNEYDNPGYLTVRNRLRTELDAWVRKYSSS